MSILTKVHPYHAALYSSWLHELSAPTVILRAIVQVDEQGFDMGKAFFDGLPPVKQTIHQAIAGHLGRYPIEKDLIQESPSKAWRDLARRQKL